MSSSKFQKKTPMKRKAIMQGGPSQVPGYTRTTSLLVSTMPKVGNKELKFKDFTNDHNTDLDLTDFDEVWNVAAVQRGDAVTQRIGMMFYPKRIELRVSMEYYYRLKTNVTVKTVRQNQPVRIMIVQDCQTNGAAMTADQLLEGTSSTAPELRFFKVENARRFKVHYDKIHVININTTYLDNLNNVQTLTATARADISVPVKDRVEFSTADQTANIANCKTNNYYVIVLAARQPQDVPTDILRGKLEVFTKTRLYFTD